MDGASSAPPPRRHGLWYWLPAVAWAAAILYFTSIPDPYALTGLHGTTASDLWAHGLCFLVLFLLVARWMGHPTRRNPQRAIAYAAFLCLAFAVLDEVHQIPIPGRSFEWVDLFLDGAGVAAGGMATLAYGARKRADGRPRG